MRKWTTTRPGIGPCSHVCHIGKAQVFSIDWAMSKGPNGEPYALYCMLPGIKSYLGMHASIDDARKKAESVFEHWLNITGLKEVKPGTLVIE